MNHRCTTHTPPVTRALFALAGAVTAAGTVIADGHAAVVNTVALYAVAFVTGAVVAGGSRRE